MDMILKGIILVLFAVVVFFKDYYPSDLLYWLTYLVMFALIPLWWRASYWVSKKTAQTVLGEDFDKSFFAGMVADNPNDDLIRGRFCILKDRVCLVGKAGRDYKILWSEERCNITSVETGRVVGVRKGFKIFTSSNNTAFATVKAEEIQKELQK